jgi:hypothetical protein
MDGRNLEERARFREQLESVCGLYGISEAQVCGALAYVPLRWRDEFITAVIEGTLARRHAHAATAPVEEGVARA